MKNKGRAISLAVCLTLLQGQISGPYYTTFASGLDTEIKNSFDKNSNSSNEISSEESKVNENKSKEKNSESLTKEDAIKDMENSLKDEISRDKDYEKQSQDAWDKLGESNISNSDENNKEDNSSEIEESDKNDKEGNGSEIEESDKNDKEGNDSEKEKLDKNDKEGNDSEKEELDKNDKEDKGSEKEKLDKNDKEDKESDNKRPESNENNSGIKDSQTEEEKQQAIKDMEDNLIKEENIEKEYEEDSDKAWKDSIEEGIKDLDKMPELIEENLVNEEIKDLESFFIEIDLKGLNLKGLENLQGIEYDENKIIISWTKEKGVENLNKLIKKIEGQVSPALIYDEGQYKYTYLEKIETLEELESDEIIKLSTNIASKEFKGLFIDLDLNEEDREIILSQGDFEFSLPKELENKKIKNFTIKDRELNLAENYDFREFIEFAEEDGEFLKLNLEAIYDGIYKIDIKLNFDIEENIDNLKLEDVLEFEKITEDEDNTLFGKENEDIELKIKAKPGYILKDLKLKEESLQVYKDDIYSFKMPKENVEIQADVGILKNIKLNASGGKFIVEEDNKENIILNLEEYNTIKSLADFEPKREWEKLDDEIVSYKFIGWATSKEGQVLEEDEPLYGKTELFAIWSEHRKNIEEILESVEVVFNKNIDSELVEGSKLPENKRLVKKEDKSYIVEEVDDLEVEAGPYDRYEFKGWGLEKLTDEKDFWNFNNNVADFLDKIDEIDGKYKLNLYAQWKVIDLFDEAIDYNEPFEINNKDALKELSKRVNSGKTYRDRYFAIAENIDLEEENWTAIGTKENPFSGNIRAYEINFKVDEGQDKDETNEDDKNLDKSDKEVGNDNIIVGDSVKDKKDEKIDQETNKEETNKEDKVDNLDKSSKYYKITGLKLSNKEDYQGLFGYIKEATIENMIVEGSIDANNKVGLVGYVDSGSKLSNIELNLDINGLEDVGSLAGSTADKVKILDINSDGKIKGQKNVGVVGSLGDKSKLYNVENNADIIGDENIGGIIGNLGSNVKIKDLTNNTDVKGKKNVGGYIGQVISKNTISNLENTVNVTGDENVGGIVGNAKANISLVDLKNTGDVSGNSKIGGILGNSEDYIDRLSQSFNEGKIHGDGDIVGGLVGKINSLKHKSKITNSTNSGEVIGNNFTGGILGLAGLERISSTIPVIYGVDIENNKNYGRIKGMDNTGGLIGSINLNKGNSTIRRNSNHGKVIGNDLVGGIIGGKDRDNFGFNIEESYNEADIEANKLVGGIISFLPKSSYVVDSYNIGKISGKKIGGIAGEIYYRENTNVEVNSSYIRSSFNYGTNPIAPEGYFDKSYNNYKLGESSSNTQFNGTYEKTKDDFKSGVIAMLLDTREDGSRKYIWGQGDKYPVLSVSDKKPVYKIDVDIKGSTNAEIKGIKSYAAGNEEVTIEILPKHGYILEILEITDKKNNTYDIKIEGNKYIFIMKEEDIKIYISIIEEPKVGEFKVIFKIDEEEYFEELVKAGKQVKRPKDPNPEKYGKEGKVFDNWYFKDKPYNFTQAVMQDIELEARWKEQNKIKVKFDLNEDFINLKENEKEPNKSDFIINKPEDIDLKIIEEVDENGNSIKVYPKIIRPLDPKVIKNSNRLINYKFKGWFTEKTGGEEWNFEKEIKNDMILYAQWEKTIVIPDGFEFRTAEELKMLSDSVNIGNTHEGKTFYLANSIDLNDLEEEWEGIGYHKHRVANDDNMSKMENMVKVEYGSLVFDGTLDGRGNTLILQSNQVYPFIGAVGKNGIVRNLNIYGKMASNKKRISFGGVAGYSYGLIERVNVHLDQIDRNKPAYDNVCGGVVGGNYGDITDINVKAYMLVESTDYTTTGGVAGISQPGLIENITIESGTHIEFIASNYKMGCVGGVVGGMFGSKGKGDGFKKIHVEKGVTIKGDGKLVGGVVGNGNMDIEDSINEADIYVENVGQVGGIIGGEWNGGETNIKRTINKGDVTGVDNGFMNGWGEGVGGISGSYGIYFVNEIKDSYSYGTIKALNDGVVSGIAPGAEVIKNSYFFGELIGGEKHGISSDASEVENSYYYSDSEELTDANNNDNMNKNQVNTEIDYKGSKRAERTQLSNGEISYYLNNIDGKQRKNKLWGVNESTGLPDFGGTFYVRVSINEVDGTGNNKPRGDVYLIDQETGEEILIKPNRYAFIKENHNYKVKIDIPVQDKNDEGEELGYGFNKLEINFGEESDRDPIDLIEVFESDETLTIDKDAETKIDYDQELSVIPKPKEKPIIPQYPENPGEDGTGDGGDSDSGSGEGTGPGSGSGSGGGSGSGSGTGSGSGSGSGRDKGDGLGSGNNEGTDVVEGQGTGAESNIESENTDGSSSSKNESQNLDSTDNNESESKDAEEQLVAKEIAKVDEDKIEDIITTTAPIEEEPEEDDLDEDNGSEKRDDDLEVKPLEEEDTEEDTEEKEEEQKLSIVEKLTDKIKENPILAAIIAAGFILINILIAIFRFFIIKKDDDE